MSNHVILPAENGELDGSFLHAVDLKNALLVHNLTVQHYLFSTDYIGVREPGLAKTYRPIDSIPIQELEAGKFSGNVLSPRVFQYQIPGAMLAQGFAFKDGHLDLRGDPVHYSENRRQRILKIKDVELAFERGRREFCPAAPSRLSCIWVVEDSPAGRRTINTMFRGAYFASVRVPVCLSAAKLDAGWFDDYWNSGRSSSIRNYWEGVACPDDSLPEILVNGVVEFIDQDQLEHVRTHGAKLGRAG